MNSKKNSFISFVDQGVKPTSPMKIETLNDKSNEQHESKPSTPNSQHQQLTPCKMQNCVNITTNDLEKNYNFENDPSCFQISSREHTASKQVSGIAANKSSTSTEENCGESQGDIMTPLLNLNSTNKESKDFSDNEKDSLIAIN